MFLHFLHHHDKRTFVLDQNVVIQIQVEQIALLDNNIETLDRNHSEIFLFSYCTTKI